VEPDPEPPRAVYHLFYVRITGDKRSVEQMRKFLSPLDLAKVQLRTPDDVFRKRAKIGRVERDYRIYIRSRQPYERAEAVIKAKPGVIRVCPPSAHISKCTVKALPIPKMTTGLPLDVPHYPDDPVHHKKKR
jgi:hypothetical protein